MARKKTVSSVADKKSIFDKIPPRASLAVGAVLTVLGIIFTCVSVAPRVRSIGAVEYFSERCEYIDDGKRSVDFDGHAAIVSGKLEYSENGAVDAVLGVSADAPMLYRISEMYQWTVVDGEAVAAWSEEIVPSPDPGHTNPSSYPSNAKSVSYVAEGVSIGDFTVSAELLSMFTEREPIEKLPDINLRGFKTVGDCITNSSDLSSPKIGDVRIRYEYVPVYEATFVGKQRSASIVKYGNYEDVPIFYAIPELLGESETVSYIRRNAEPATAWLLVLSVLASVGGGFIFFASLCRATGYKPSFSRLGKKFAAVEHGKVTLIHSAIFGALAFLLPFSIAWAKVYEIGIALVALVTVLWLAILIPDMFFNMPRPEKKEAEYVPILIKRDESETKKTRK